MELCRGHHPGLVPAGGNAGSRRGRGASLQPRRGSSLSLINRAGPWLPQPRTGSCSPGPTSPRWHGSCPSRVSGCRVASAPPWYPVPPPGLGMAGGHPKHRFWGSRGAWVRSPKEHPGLFSLVLAKLSSRDAASQEFGEKFGGCSSQLTPAAAGSLLGTWGEPRTAKPPALLLTASPPRRNHLPTATEAKELRPRLSPHLCPLVFGDTLGCSCPDVSVRLSGAMPVHREQEPAEGSRWSQPSHCRWGQGMPGEPP